MDRHSNTKLSLNIVFFYAIVLIALRLISSFFKEMRLWGFNQAGYFPILIVLYIVLIICAIFLIANAAKSIARKEAIHQKMKLGVSPFIILASFAILFWILSAKAHFLGDGYLLVSIVKNAALGFRPIEYGELWVHRFVLGLLGTFNDHNALNTYKIVSIGGGIIFLSVLLYYAKSLTTTVIAYNIFVLAIMTSAFSILFYGYVEHYTLTTAVLGIFLLSGASAIYRNKYAIVAFVAFPCAILLHKIAIVYFPAFFILLLLTILKNRDDKYTRISAKYWFLSILILFSLFYILLWRFGSFGMKINFLPIGGWKYTLDHYALFSSNHIIDFINLVTFLCPLIILIIALVLIAKNKQSRGNSKVILFLGTASIGGLLSAFIVDPRLGMARDWDMMSVMIIGVTITAAYLWVTYWKDRKYFAAASGLLIILNLSIIIPWIALNNSPKELFNYDINISSLDEKHGVHGIETAEIYAYNIQDQVSLNMIRDYKKIHFPERDISQKGFSYYFSGNFEEAERTADMAIALNPQFQDAYKNKSFCQYSTGRYAESIASLKIDDDLNPCVSSVNYYIGRSYAAMNDNRSAIKYWRKSIYYDSSNRNPYMAIGNYFYRIDNLDSAMYYYTVFPDSTYQPDIYYLIGMAQLKMGKKADALPNFDKYLSVGKDSMIIKNIRHLKETL